MPPLEQPFKETWLDYCAVLCWTEALRLTHSVLPVVTVWVSSACLCRTCRSTAGETPMSEEQRFRWAERLFWDLNLLPQMGQSGTPGGGGGGGGAGTLSSLASKHLQGGMRRSHSVCKHVSDHPSATKNTNVPTCSDAVSAPQESCVTRLCGRSDRRRVLCPPGPLSQPAPPPCPALAAAAGPELHRCPGGEQRCWALEVLHTDRRVDQIQQSSTED